MFIANKIDWDAISAISQIAAALATVIAVFVSLRIAKLSITSKAKIIIGREGRLSDRNHFVFLNVGHSKINIKAHGLMLVKSIWPSNRNNVVAIAKDDKIEVDQSADFVFRITNNDIGSRLINLCDCKHGERVKLIVFFLDSKNKRFEKRFKFKII